VRDEGEDAWIVSGMLRSDELEEVVGWSFPESEVYETLAGYMVAELQRLANVGDAVTRDDWQLIVTRVDGRRIAEVRVVRPPKVPAAVAVSGGEEAQ
jgi:CBS domain containing-hemolysin-like protein